MQKYKHFTEHLPSILAGTSYSGGSVIFFKLDNTEGRESWAVNSKRALSIQKQSEIEYWEW